jgi:hypothetical protein
MIRDENPGSRTRILIFTHRGSQIPDPGVEKAPDPGIEKALDLGSRFQIRNTAPIHTTR